MARGVSDCRHDGCGGRKNKRTRAEHDEDRYGPDDFPGKNPGENGGGKSHDDNPCGRAIRKVDDFRLAGFGGLYELDHPLDGTVLADPCREHIERSELVDGAGKDFIARSLIDREGFSGQDRLVDGGFSAKNLSVNGNGFSGEHPNPVACLDIFRRNDSFRAFRDDSGRFGRETHEPFDSRTSLFDRTFFEEGSELHDESDFSCRKVFSDGKRCDESDGDEKIGLDVESGEHSDDCALGDGYSAQDDGNPG